MDQIVELPVVETIIEDHLVKGAIDILDVRFGSLGPLSHEKSFTSWDQHSVTVLR